ALRRTAPDRRHRALCRQAGQGRHPRRADSRARRRPDGAGPQPGASPRRLGRGGHHHLPQPAGRLQGRRRHLRPVPGHHDRAHRRQGHDARRRRRLHHRHQAHGGGGRMSAQDSHAPTAATPEQAPSLLGKGMDSSLKGAFEAWISRIRAGDMGALPAIGGLVVLLILFSQLNDNFLGPRNIANLLTQSAALVTLGMALVFVLLLGEIDLSAGVTFGVAASVFVRLTQPEGLNWVLALVIALAIGAAIGAFTGFFVAKVGVPSFVVTLGPFLGLQGVLLVIIGAGGTYRLIPEPIKAIQYSNMPTWAGWLMLAIALALLLAVAYLDRW